MRVELCRILKRGWSRTGGRRNKDFTKGGKLGQEVGALKRADWNPLTNYDCLGSFLSVRPVDQGRRQLSVRFCSRW